MAGDKPPSLVEAHMVPRFRRGVRMIESETHGGWLLMAPERVFKPDPVAAEILKRCTGESTVSAIVDDLASCYAAPRDQILDDVIALLASLAEKRLLELSHGK